MNKLINFNENLNTPLYRPSFIEHQQKHQQKHHYFDVPDIDSKITRQDSPRYWLQLDI